MKLKLIWYQAKTFKLCRKFAIFTSHWYEWAETPKMLSEKASRIIAVVNNWNSSLEDQSKSHIEHRVDARIRDNTFFFSPNSPYLILTIKFTFN